MVTLTPEQIAQYHEEGYLVLRANEHGLATPEALKAWTDEIAAWPRVPGKWMQYDETTASGEKQLMRTENFADYHDGYGRLLLGPDLRGLLGQLTGDEMLLFKDKINYKLPHANGFNPHIDAPAYDHIGSIEHTTANLAIDAAIPENGCLEIVPGSHHMDVKLAYGAHIADDWVQRQNWVQIPLAAGDLLIFGSHLAHRSAPYTTGDRRASLYATYYCRKDGDDLRQRYYTHRRLNFPPEHERDPERDYTSSFKIYASAGAYIGHDVARAANGMQKA
ncbi:PhyH-domain-containing protein [Thozetella sp. PMI_491]|nr:PhyH-domain-containing protein [Thozetella sp. PMI_491]